MSKRSIKQQELKRKETETVLKEYVKFIHQPFISGLFTHSEYIQMFLNRQEVVAATEIEVQVFEFLDILRESGATNMFGAKSYIIAKFGINDALAGRLLVEWMERFTENR